MSLNSLENLNSEQKKAVLATEGPVLILAGAGAGKTKTLTERVRHLVQKGVEPNSILAITFTNKAAKEMRERIEQGLSNDPMINRPISMLERPFVSTFHSLGVHILREQASKIGKKRNFIIFDRDDSKKAVREALEILGLDPKTNDPNRILGAISKEKSRGNNLAGFNNEDGDGYFFNMIAQVWPEYERVLERDNALDFDDLLVKTMELLSRDEEVRNYYRNIWKYVHIDEYQDTNRVQYEISRMLVGASKNICVVGDIDQNIYSWRGADIKNILAFEKDYPDTQVVVLEENYRSTKTILEAANAVIEKNKMRREKKLFTENNAGEKIVLFHGPDERNEAEFVADKAKAMIENGWAPEEIVVLYRANFQSRVLEEAFMNRGIAYQLLGTKFFERKEVKDLVSYLRAAINPDSISDLKRIINVPTRGLGKTTVLKIFTGQEDSLSPALKNKYGSFKNLLAKIASVSREKKPSETIAFIIEASGLEDEWKGRGDEDTARLENAYELANFASRYDHLKPEDGILEFLSDSVLQSDQDELEDKQKSVRLMTIHASKGLEFDAVFITGLEEGLFPHERSSDANMSSEESEEERRLFYVALTRGRKKIYLSYAEMRTLFGRTRVNIPSEFIFDIPEHLIKEEAYNEKGYCRRKPLLEIDF